MSSKYRLGLGLSAIAGLLLAGCSLIGQPWRKQEPPAPPVVTAAPPPPPLPELPTPQSMHRFELTDPDTHVVGEVQLTIASKEDTLPDIARRFNVGYEEIVRANPGVDPWLPGPGRRIVVPTRFVLPNAPHEGVVINLAALRLYYYPKRAKGAPEVVYTYPIGIGKVGWKTPEGATKIVSRQKDPVWRPTVAVRKEHADNGDPIPAVVPAGPDNPLGKYKFTLGWPSYLIHGTNKPYGVGLRSSHGCIRLYPEDIEVLFNSAPIGTTVRVVNQPFLFAYHDGELILQAYTVLEDDTRNWAKAERTLLSKSMSLALQQAIKANSVDVNWDAVNAVTHKPRGIPVRVSSRADAEPDTVEAVVAAATLVQNRIPEGSNWDGADDIERDEASYQQLLREREQPLTATPSARTPAKTATAPAAAPGPRG
jgi:L,D-transpeptidase ErfK/SrfK